MRLHATACLPIALTVFLAGCSTNAWYVSPGTATDASLRAVALVPGNSFVGIVPDGTCDESGAAMLGWFHPAATAGLQASRRGFDRRIGMPGGEAYPPNTYAEHRVAADKTVRFVANSAAPRSANPFEVDQCTVFADAPLSAGKSYEVVFRRPQGACELKVFELVPRDAGPTSRVPVPSTLACRR